MQQNPVGFHTDVHSNPRYCRESKVALAHADLDKRTRLWNSAELLVLVLVLVLGEAVLAIEKDGKSRAN